MNFPPIADHDWPAPIKELRQGFAGRLNVYRVMAHHAALLAAWAPLRDHVVVHTSLGKQFSEVVILRTGVKLGSDYEWAHHVSRGRACGLTDARIASIAGPLDGMAPDDRVLAAAVDELLGKAQLSGPVQQRVLERVGAEGLFDLIATVGFYSTLAFMLKSFGTPIDADVATEMAQRPLAL